MPEKDLDYEYPKMLKFILAREGGYVNITYLFNW